MEALTFGVLCGLTVAVVLIMFINIKCLEQLKQIAEQLKDRKGQP